MAEKVTSEFRVRMLNFPIRSRYKPPHTGTARYLRGDTSMLRVTLDGRRTVETFSASLFERIKETVDGE
jgi:hypothetical protein